jgi:hypothetical protein
MTGRLSVLLAAFGILVPGGAAALEAPQSFRAEYSISIYGLPIARSTFTSRISGDTFHVHGSLSSAGIAKIFDNTKGTTSVSGRFEQGTVRPENYLVNYTSGKKKKKIEIAFAEGNVTRTESVPPPKKRGDDWVSLGRNHLRAVTDPLSSTLVRADRPAEVCNRTLKMYDGELRADLKLSYVSTKPISTGGYQGVAVTCEARFIPVAGYRPGHKSIEFLKNRSNIAIAFAPLGTTGVYAPVRASVGTEIGTVRIEAVRLETVQ